MVTYSRLGEAVCCPRVLAVLLSVWRGEMSGWLVHVCRECAYVCIYLGYIGYVGRLCGDVECMYVCVISYMKEWIHNGYLMDMYIHLGIYTYIYEAKAL